MTNREIDEAVAKKLGWTRCNDEEEGEIRWHHDKPLIKGTHGGQCALNLPLYSTSIEAAWEILTDYCDEWHLDCRGTVTVSLKKHHSGPVEVTDDNAPLAVCKTFSKLTENDEV